MSESASIRTRCGICDEFPCDHIVWRTGRIPAKGEVLEVDGVRYDILDTKLTPDGLGYTLSLSPSEHSTP